MSWLKKSWGWVLGALAAVVGLITALVLMIGGRKRQPPILTRRRPAPLEMPPENEPVILKNEVPYEKKTTHGSLDDAIASANKRHE